MAKNFLEYSEYEVVKHFNSEQDYYTEMDVYRLKLAAAPKLLDFKPAQWIKLQRIHGKPYMDVQFDPERLAMVIASFHTATMSHGKCLCHIDNQPGNILESNGRYYLLDFSDSRLDFPERDISHFLLFWAADFGRNCFISYASKFLKYYCSLVPLTSGNWQLCLRQSIQSFDSRREQHGKPGGKNPLPLQQMNRDWLFELDP